MSIPASDRPPVSVRLRRALARGRTERSAARPLEAQEIWGREALSRITRVLPPVERAYATIRFSIMRPKLLSVLDLLLPEEGRILDIGCGFGLFAAYFAQTQRARQIVGVDPDARRTAMAARTFEKLGLDGQFLAGDARDAHVEGPFDAAYVLDVMHHIPRSDQVALLERLHGLLAPRGVLIIKDITTEPWLGLKFTEYLDRAMVGWNEPLAYRHHREWGELLRGLGFKVRAVRVPDVLPYPHVVIAATKGDW
ncbi:MAG: Methyltransferase type 12 [Labilithrix sp.]|nr:Methyltransferase type 12 [Labilithrix sp.]